MKATKKIFNYDDKESILDILHTPIACGFYHCLGIVELKEKEKALYGWGKNQFGELGQGHLSNFDEEVDISYQPTEIKLKVGKKTYIPLQVSCGKSHSAVLATDLSSQSFKAGVEPVVPAEGEVFIFGDDSNGKLGLKKDEPVIEEKKDPDTSNRFMRKMDTDSFSQIIVKTVVKFPSGNPKIKMISCGSTFTLALDVNGNVYSWGEGATGALGTGLLRDEHFPIKVNFPGLNTTIKFINAGYFHAAAISKKGHLYTWGVGSEGQLGHKSNMNISSPKKVEFFEEGEAAFVSCGMFHTGCIDEKGFLYSWGGNKNGQLGHGDYDDRNFPTLVKFFKNFCVVYINFGSNTSFVITEEGKVFSFGSNLNGKLAGSGLFELETLQSNSFPTPLESQLSISRIAGDIGEDLENSRIYHIATSNQFCMALTNKGILLTWGSNNNGCLGRNDKNDEIIDNDPFPGAISEVTFKITKKESGAETTFSSVFIEVKAGLYHSVGLTNAGEVYVWGSNQYSQHGISSNKLKENANKMQEKINFALEYFDPNMLPSLVDTFDIKENKKVSHISCGYEYVFAVQNNKIVYSWGRNTHGQCGIGSVSNYVEEPHMISMFDSHVIKDIVCGERHTLILDDKGDLYACGCSYGGKLGLGFMTTVQTSPKQLNLKGVIAVACGPNHSMALVKETKKENQSKTVLYTWGNGWNGELGHGNKDNVYSPKYIETKYNFKSISCGTHHSAGITDDNNLAVWGPYKYLGVPIPEELTLDRAYFFIPTLHPFCTQNENNRFSSVFLGDKYNLALTPQKEVYFWGVFDITYQKIMETAATQGTNQEGAYEKKIKFPSRLETDLKFDNVAVSNNHALGISAKLNKLYSWGIDGNTGRLGLGYEYIDDELEDDNKKIQKQKYAGITSYNQPLSAPCLIHFLHYLLDRLSKEAKAKLNSVVEKALELRNNINSHKGAAKSNEKIYSVKNIGNSMQNFNFSDKKSAQLDSRKHPSTIMDKSSRFNSSLFDNENEAYTNRYDLYQNCQSKNPKINLLNYQFTQSLYHDNLIKYQEIRKGLQDILSQIQNRKKMKKRIEGIILKRISSYPFEANFISKDKKLEKVKQWPQFFLNKKKFQAIFTILQLHPCYFLNIYKSDKLAPDAFFQLVVETYGDMENDNRKIALFINLCHLILKYDMEKHIRNLNGIVEDYELNLSLDPNNSFYIFVKLFIHLFNSSIINKKWLKFCLRKILKTFDDDIYDNDQFSKSSKQNALVFRDTVALPSDADKKKFYIDKVSLLVKIMSEVMKEYNKPNINLEISKDIKRLAEKIRAVLSRQKLIIQTLTDDEIKKKILNLIFTPLYNELYSLELIGKAKYDDDQTNKKERILANNYIAFNEALKHFIRGKPIIPNEHRETWLDDLNRFIQTGEAIRTTLYTNFASNQYKDKKQGEKQHQRMLKHVFKHSFSNKQEIIQISLKNLVCISTLIHNSISEWKVMNPVEKEILSIIDKKLVEEGQNFHNYNFKLEDNNVFFNLKLKTKQLRKIDNEKKIKQCKNCKSYLIEDFLKTEDHNIVEEFPILNPESLESLLFQIISIEDFDKSKFDLLFSNKSTIENIMEDFLNATKKDRKYEEIQTVRNFLKQFRDHIAIKKSKDSFESYSKIKKTNQNNEINSFSLIKEIKKNLEEKAIMASNYVAKNEILQETLTGIHKKYILANDVIPLSFYEKAIKLCFYGLANREFEKPLQNNPIALSGKMGASIRATSMSNDLYENMQYLLDEKEKNFSLFGFYSYKLLKSKGILESLNEDVFYKISLPKLQQKISRANRSEINKLKNNFYYLFADNKRQGLEISLCYRQVYFKVYRWLCGASKKNTKNFEIIVEKFEIKEEELLIIRKREREVENTKTEKIILDIGKYSKFNLSRFLELINSLQNHYMIYDDIFVKAG